MRAARGTMVSLAAGSGCCKRDDTPALDAGELIGGCSQYSKPRCQLGSHDSALLFVCVMNDRIPSLSALRIRRE